MSKRDEEATEREKRERERREHRGKRHEREREESGDDPKRHASIIARRWEGSNPPTAQAYKRALDAWRKLPGAVVTPPTDLGDVPAGPSPEDSDRQLQRPENNNRD